MDFFNRDPQNLVIAILGYLVYLMFDPFCVISKRKWENMGK